MARTAPITRQAAHEHQAALLAQRRRRDQDELDASTAFAIADAHERKAQAGKAAAAETLLQLGNTVAITAILIGHPEPEIRQLRKLATHLADPRTDETADRPLPLITTTTTAWPAAAQ